MNSKELITELANKMGWTPKEVAEMLGIGYSNFKKLEAEGTFPFQRKMV